MQGVNKHTLLPQVLASLLFPHFTIIVPGVLSHLKMASQHFENVQQGAIHIPCVTVSTIIGLCNVGVGTVGSRGGLLFSS